MKYYARKTMKRLQTIQEKQWLVRHELLCILISKMPPKRDLWSNHPNKEIRKWINLDE